MTPMTPMAQTAHRTWHYPPLSWRRGILLAALAVALVVGVAACVPPGTPDTIVQGEGLPTLHMLDWGFGYYEGQASQWSPDGRWIAVMAGASVRDLHLVVVSPDGHTKYDLSSWGCDSDLGFDVAWTSDSKLTCIQDHGYTYSLCTGASPFTTCQSVPVPRAFRGSDDGAAWAPDGSYLLVSGEPGDPADNPTPPYASKLNVITPTGAVVQVLGEGDDSAYSLPQWRPHTAELSYEVDDRLVVGDITGAAGKLSLAQPETLATGGGVVYGYAWSPSGRWVVAEFGGTHEHTDNFYLVDADQPNHTIEVVDNEANGRRMNFPIWSPDGSTIIVFDSGSTQPFAFNIASPGFQP